MLIDIDRRIGAQKLKGEHTRVVDNEEELYIEFEYKGEWDIVYYSRRIAEGIYETDLNFGHYIEQCVKGKIISWVSNWAEAKTGLNHKDNFEELIRYYRDLKEFYGVADSVEQIINHPEYKKQFIDSEDKFVLCVTPIYREHQPKHGGWRWHKWGEYIGDHEIQCEYLYNEKDIDVVYVFHFYNIQ
jgi:hypothetical protein